MSQSHTLDQTPWCEHGISSGFVSLLAELLWCPKTQPLSDSFPSPGLYRALSHHGQFLTSASLPAWPHLSPELQNLHTHTCPMHFISLGKSSRETGPGAKRGGSAGCNLRDVQSFSALAHIPCAPHQSLLLPSQLCFCHSYICLAASSSTWFPAQWLCQAPWSYSQKSSVPCACNTCPGSWRFSSWLDLLRPCLKHQGKLPEHPVTLQICRWEDGLQFRRGKRQR